MIFLDGHVFPNESTWMSSIVKFIQKNDKVICGPCIIDHSTGAVGYGITLKGAKLDIDWLFKKSDTPYEVPVVGAACLGIKRESFFDIGGFSDNFTSWGYDEAEICIKAWLSGYRIFLLPNVSVSHIFKYNYRFDVPLENFYDNLLTLAILHLSHERVDKIISTLSKEFDITGILATIKEKNLVHKRRQLKENRVHDDNWLFNKFEIRFN